MQDTRRHRIQELLKVISPQLITLENGATARVDEAGKLIEELCTCGTCHMQWNDALGSSFTPAPSARCPYEYIHPELSELRRLSPEAFAQLQPRLTAA